MNIAWRPQISVDNGVIDDDHRTLIEIINAFINLKYDREILKFKKVLMKLDEYAKFHFERE